MRTKKEQIKSIILIILVGLSIFLTWNIWSYQPRYDFISNGTTVENVSIGTKKEIEDVIKPTKMIYSISNQLTLGTTNPLEIENIMNEIQKWDVSKLTNISYSIDNFYSFTNSTNQLQLQFAISVPMEIYKTTLDEKNSDLPKFTFDRILLDLSHTSQEYGNIYFVSSQSKEIYQSSVPASLLTGIKRNYLENNNKLVRYQYKTIANDRRIYFQEDTSNIYSYQHLFMPIESDQFKNALFKNPDLVQKNSIISGTEFTDGFSILRIYDNYVISYVNPSEMLQGFNYTSVSTSQMIRRSIDYVNTHAGWNYTYQLMSNNNIDNQIEFRMFYPDGLPIYSDTPGLSTINLRLGNNGIVEYFRGNYTLGVEMERFQIDLLSGNEVFNYLNQMENFDLDNMEDLTLGYKMKREGSSRIVYLLPTWYYKMDNQWYEISLDLLERGQNNGLEQN